VLLVGACGVASCGSSDDAGTTNGTASITSTTTGTTFASEEAEACYEILAQGGTVDECQELPGISFEGGVPVPTTIVEPKPLESGAVARALDVAAAIKAAGIGCDEASIDTVPQRGTRANPVTDQTSCSIRDDTVTVSLFPDAAAMRAADEYLRTGACYVAEQQDGNLTYVEGEHWIVFPEYATTASRLADVLPVEIRTIEC
jgi:hypothetical protein